MAETKKAYRTYVLNVTSPDAPIVHLTHVAAATYADAWKVSRAALDADKRGKSVTAGHVASLYNDAERKDVFALSGKAFTVARIDDATPRNAKIDVKALAATLTGEGDAQAKLNAFAAALGVTLAPAK